MPHEKPIWHATHPPKRVRATASLGVPLPVVISICGLAFIALVIFLAHSA